MDQALFPLCPETIPDVPAPLAALFAVAGEFRLLLWDGPGATAPKGLRLAVDGRPAQPPYTLLTVGRPGGHRTLSLLQVPDSLGSPVLTLGSADGNILCLAEGVDARDFDAAALLDGLEPPQKLRVVRLFLDFGRSHAALRTDAAFVEACRRLVTALAAKPQPIQARVAATDRLVYLEGGMAPAFGELLDSAVLLDGALAALAVKPELGRVADRKGQRPLRVVLDKGLCRDDALLVLVGEGGLALRSPRGADGRLPTLLQAGAKGKPLPAGVRDFFTKSLGERPGTDQAAAAALREVQVLAPLARRQASDPGLSIGAGLDLAIPGPDGGLFVAGWLHDPEGLADGLSVLSPFGPARTVGRDAVRFPREDIATLYKAAPGGRPGFAAWLPGPAADARLRQVRAELKLKSGGSIELVAPPRPADWAACRAAVLGAVPPQALGPEGLEKVIAPAVAALHRAHMGTRGAAEEITLGTPPRDPDVSVIVPLYRNLSFLRFQMAAFATDPSLAGMDLRFVLDSPEQRDELVHFLEGLHGLYGLPFTLLVQPANYGYSAANNAGAEGARGRHLLLLNSDVIPDRPGWLPGLVEMLESDGRIGAVGPKLLFDDDSLQHAGLYFDRDPRGRWYNHHYFKGMPRDFAPACKPRRVPGVTGACLMMSRDLYSRLGGLSEDYVIGDFEDSDLCLRIRQAGFEIVYEPRVELYHLERQSITRHAGYTRGVASLYNGWLHAGRWSDTMAELMSQDWQPAGGARR